ncbi:acyltransferase family protein [Secundilactobacillus kimchicus]|uniref:acyltransferase family protein n=1 Tax=Secundilactobacillus kimchicus TaxID=528209 RepID=UPI0024A7C537|nr:acyltransferase [Secundilactobacillus kimchicus]
MGKRVEWVDMAKAIGMIAVVFGHALHPMTDAHHSVSVLFGVLYWWHMPLFFIIGGFFLKPIEQNLAAFKRFFMHRVWPNIKMYFGAGTILILLAHFLRGHSWHYTAWYFLRLVYGGRTLNKTLTIFWFITVYVLTLIVVVILISYVKSIPAQFFIAFTMFAAGVSYKHMHFLVYKYVPWDADIVLLTTLYMLVGYYGFKLYPQVPHKGWIFLSTAVMFIVLAFLKYQRLLVFSLSLKSHKVHNSFLGAFVPIAISLAIFILSDWMTSSHFFDWLLPIGLYSNAIMYMHRLVFDVLAHVPGIDNWLMQTILGLVIPVIVASLYKRGKHWWHNRQLPTTS